MQIRRRGRDHWWRYPKSSGGRQSAPRFRNARIDRSRLILMQFSFDRKIIVGSDCRPSPEMLHRLHTSLHPGNGNRCMYERAGPRSYWTSLVAVNCCDKQCFDGLLRELAMPCNGGRIASGSPGIFSTFHKNHFGIHSSRFSTRSNTTSSIHHLIQL